MCFSLFLESCVLIGEFHPVAPRRPSILFCFFGKQPPIYIYSTLHANHHIIPSLIAFFFSFLSFPLFWPLFCFLFLVASKVVVFFFIVFYLPSWILPAHTHTHTYTHTEYLPSSRSLNVYVLFGFIRTMCETPALPNYLHKRRTKRERGERDGD